jgi:N-acetylmuramoyl-L-alanine amidase
MKDVSHMVIRRGENTMAKKIMWDPGHGGSDSGAAANGLQEEHLTLKIVNYAVEYLKAHYTDFEQRVTRGHEQTLTLTNRDDEADSWGANVFVSVHINAGGGSGFESYIHNNAGASTVALQNMVHNEVLATMRRFGSTIDRGKKRADFFVLRETNMDAILTENLFIDSNDANHLKTEAFLKAVGEAHARGVAIFLGLPSKQVSQPAPLSQPQGIGNLKVLENTVIRDRPVYLGNITGQVKTGDQYIVHDYQTGWFNIGGWVYKNHVQFIPHDDVKMSK